MCPLVDSITQQFALLVIFGEESGLLADRDLGMELEDVLGNLVDNLHPFVRILGHSFFGFHDIVRSQLAKLAMVGNICFRPYRPCRRS